ncbi:MAG: hydantoinase/oxoprolinase N-terminal domain-containing protein [Anaerolineae bacterium]
MTLVLGIDTGGTYTDAALVDYDTGQVLSKAKALTTRRDLSIGIGGAIDGVFRQEDAPLPADVSLVALSTTLATNAIVEGQGSPVCLILIGYDRDLIRQYGFERELVTDDVVYVDGGHDIHGDEAAPLDEATLREAVLARRELVEAFAVSGYFGVRNPAHELRAKGVIEQLTGLPVTCGHELTTRLNAVRRATTVALNARLVPLLRELIDILRHTLAGRGLTAPLMVVKGDGSLVRAEWAMLRPIETILSGPAASAVGAWHLGAQAGTSFENGALWVVDIGGTTTDIAALRDGRPRLNPEGAQVGRWRTMVEAVDVHTVGLGGDSHVRLDGNRRVRIGPRRVVPLSLLATQYPEIVGELQNQVAVPPRDEVAAQFLLARRRPTRPLLEDELVILDRLAHGPVSLLALVRDARFGTLVLRRIEDLIAERLVMLAGFTPTDALHALGRLDLWHAEAAQLGAQVLANQGRRTVEDLCHAVVEGVSNRATQALVSKILSDEAHLPDWEHEPTAALLLERAMSDRRDSDLAFALTLRLPLVAIGAPVEAYMPRVADTLRTRLIIPPHAEVANAVGAVAGSVVQRQRVIIEPVEAEDTLRLHLPQGLSDFHDLEQAVAWAQQQMIPWLEAQARQAGAAQVKVEMTRQDARVAARAGWGDHIYIGTELIFTAVGRPSPAAREARRDRP